MNISRPAIIIESDYDGYFEEFVNGLVARKEGPFNHATIVVTAGPYRPYAVNYRIDEMNMTIHLDFYSAFRNGFGLLGEDEITALIELL